MRAASIWLVSIWLVSIGLVSIGLTLGCASSSDGGEGGSTGASTGGSGVGNSGPVSCTGGTVDCDGACVDLASDPNNCGACGRTCVVPSAAAACIASECALASCDLGTADCDGDLANGCEAEASCDEGGGCATSCGSVGLLDCSDACNPSCLLPPESCNLVDDDCNGLCDDGAVAGCRIGVHRANGPNGHFYSTDQNEASSGGNTIEALDYFFLYAGDTGDSRPFFRCNKGGGKYFMTTSTDCEQTGAPVLTVGFISATEQCGSTPLYRLQSPAATQFYTTSAAERDNAINSLGFADEGVAGHVWAAP
jgi:Repeat of unknown function (DUF5648)